MEQIQLIIQYIILGIVQGITEPLPISSSGHLVIAKALFNIEDTGDAVLEIMLHLGSLIAIVYFYWDDIKLLFGQGFAYLWQSIRYLSGSKEAPNREYQKEFKYGLNLIIATIPAGIIGLLFKDQISELLSQPRIVGFMLLLTAVFLFIANKVRGTKDAKQFKPKNALITGLVQVVALIPGISRSGSTTSVSLIQGFDIETSMKFSFMMFIPIAVAAILSGIKDLLALPNLMQLILPYFFGILSSAIVTLICLRFFKKILQKRRLDLFAYYCVVVGILTILFL